MIDGIVNASGMLSIVSLKLSFGLLPSWSGLSDYGRRPLKELRWNF